jgi:hypothetical protein
MNHDPGRNTNDDEQRSTMRTTMSYLVRCWTEGTSFRFSLERIGQDKRRGFDNVSGLLAALKQELEREQE